LRTAWGRTGRLVEEGGTAVSVGSDAHLRRRVGDRFKLAVDIVEAAGFTAGCDPCDFWRV
jgi:histidinol-phosphatase (PHP family)